MTSINLVAIRSSQQIDPKLLEQENVDSVFTFFNAVEMHLTTFCVGDDILCASQFKPPTISSNQPHISTQISTHVGSAPNSTIIGKPSPQQLNSLRSAQTPTIRTNIPHLVATFNSALLSSSFDVCGDLTRHPNLSSYFNPTSGPNNVPSSDIPTPDQQRPDVLPYMSAHHPSFTSSFGQHVAHIEALLQHRQSGLKIVVLRLYRFQSPTSTHVIKTDVRLVTNISHLIDHAFILSPLESRRAPPIPCIFDVSRAFGLGAGSSTSSSSSSSSLSPSQLNAIYPIQKHTPQTFICSLQQHLNDPRIFPIASNAVQGHNNFVSDMYCSIHGAMHAKEYTDADLLRQLEQIKLSGANPASTTALTITKKHAINIPLPTEQPVKRGRGRPPKVRPSTVVQVVEHSETIDRPQPEQQEEQQEGHSQPTSDNQGSKHPQLSTLQKLKAYCRFISLQFDVLEHHHIETAPSQYSDIAVQNNQHEHAHPPQRQASLVSAKQTEPDLYQLYRKVLQPGYIGTAVDGPLSQRDAEFARIYDFVKSGLFKNKAGGALLISGLPGTGKTASVQQVLYRLEQDAATQVVMPHSVVRINATQLRDPHEIYPLLLQGLTRLHPLGYKLARLSSPAQALVVLTHLLKDAGSQEGTYRRSGRPRLDNSTSSASLNDTPFLGQLLSMGENDIRALSSSYRVNISPHMFTPDMLHYCVFIVDEADYMITTQQKELYQLLDFPSSENLPLSIMLISNTFSLWETSLRILSRVGLQQISFSAYTASNLEEIINARLHLARQQYLEQSRQYFDSCLTNNTVTLSDTLQQSAQQFLMQKLTPQVKLQLKNAPEEHRSRLRHILLVDALASVRLQQEMELCSFDDESIRFAASKIALITGDCRRILTSVNSALSQVYNEVNAQYQQQQKQQEQFEHHQQQQQLLPPRPKYFVTIRAIMQALQSTNRADLHQFFQSLSPSEIMVLTAMMFRLVSFTKSGEPSNIHFQQFIPLSVLHTTYTTLLRTFDIPHLPTAITQQPITDALDKMIPLHAADQTILKNDLVLFPELQRLTSLGILGTLQMTKSHIFLVFWYDEFKDDIIKFLLSYHPWITERIKNDDSMITYETSSLTVNEIEQKMTDLYQDINNIVSAVPQPVENKNQQSNNSFSLPPDSVLSSLPDVDEIDLAQAPPSPHPDPISSPPPKRALPKDTSDSTVASTSRRSTRLRPNKS